MGRTLRGSGTVTMTHRPRARFVSRGGDKLAAALEHFSISPSGLVCADLGSHVGGFVDCLLQNGAASVYSVDTAYGQLAWKLRKDPRVVVLERTNALHVTLPEPIQLLTIDVGWTPQSRILAHASTLARERVDVITLIKPHYEASPDELQGGVLPREALPDVIRRTTDAIAALGWQVLGLLESPILGHGGNAEVLAWLRRPSILDPKSVEA